MAHVENAEMIEVDENDKFETVNLDFDQGDWVGHVGGASGGGGVSIDIIDIEKVFNILDTVDVTLVKMMINLYTFTK
jgi:hypothetical protein